MWLRYRPRGRENNPFPFFGGTAVCGDFSYGSWADDERHPRRRQLSPESFREGPPAGATESGHLRTSLRASDPRWFIAELRYRLLANGLESWRAQSTNNFVAGLSVRCFKVIMPIGHI